MWYKCKIFCQKLIKLNYSFKIVVKLFFSKPNLNIIIDNITQSLSWKNFSWKEYFAAAYSWTFFNREKLFRIRMFDHVQRNIMYQKKIFQDQNVRPRAAEQSLSGKNFSWWECLAAACSQTFIIMKKFWRIRMFDHVHQNILYQEKIFTDQNVWPRAAEHSVLKKKFFRIRMFDDLQPNILYLDRKFLIID